MARLQRKNQKVFAGEATNNGVFGSLQAGTKQYSNDVETIQSLDAYNEGWNSATISSEKLPPLEEFQSLQYMMTSQLAYIFQEGVPEWNANTTYYSGSCVKVIDGSNFSLFVSLVDNNTSATTVSSDWGLVFSTESGVQNLTNLVQNLNNPNTTTYPSTQAVQQAIIGALLPVGLIAPWSTDTAPEGWLICDGSAISRTTYAGLFAVIGTTYGEGDGNTTFNIPDCNERFLQGGTPGTYNSESLPNITGSVALDVWPTYQSGTFYQTGAFTERTSRQMTGRSTNVGTNTLNWVQNFDASASSSTYQNDAKVQPANLEIQYIIKY